MRSKRLFAAIGNIDGKFINEDAEIVTTTKDCKKTRLVYRFAGLAACAAVLMLCVWTIPRLFNTPTPNIPNNPGVISSGDQQGGEQATNSPSVNGIIIVGDKEDSVSADELEGEDPVFISPMLQDAINSAKPGDKIKTVVFVPGYYDFLNAFEVDGIVYGELWHYLRSGEWKADFGWDFANSDSDNFLKETEEKLAGIEKQASLAFYEKTISELGIEESEPIIVDGYSSGSFIAILTPEKIVELEAKKCYMRLWWAGQDGQTVIHPGDDMIYDE